jgi:hypothetical protein
MTYWAITLLSAKIWPEKITKQGGVGRKDAEIYQEEHP